MRILVVTQYFWPENFRINDLVAELVRRGHSVTVLTGRPNYPDGQIFPEFLHDPDRFTCFEGATIVRVPLVPRGKEGARLLFNYLSFAASATVLGLWKLRRQCFDVVFAYEPSPITVGIPAAAMRAAKRAPLIFWVLDLWPETLHAVGVVRSNSILAAVGRLVSWVYARCDLVLAQSRSFIPKIKLHAGAAKPVEYFPGWAESAVSQPDALPAPEVPVNSSVFSVMFAGNIGAAQDFPTILDTAELLRAEKIRWLIVGDGRMAAWLADEIKRRALEESVIMLGRHSLERMPSFFKTADALLVSLRDEPIFSMTIPAKIQAYLGAGLPIIAMLNGEGAELISKAQAGVTCAAGDSSALARAVSSLAGTTEEERRAMGCRGLQLATSEFDRDMLIGRLESWMGQLSRSQRSRRAGLQT